MWKLQVHNSILGTWHAKDLEERFWIFTKLELPLLAKKGLIPDNLDLTTNGKGNKLTEDLPIRRDWSSGQDIGFPSPCGESQLRGFESRIPHILDVYDAGSKKCAF